MSPVDRGGRSRILIPAVPFIVPRRAPLRRPGPIITTPTGPVHTHRLTVDPDFVGGNPAPSGTLQSYGVHMYGQQQEPGEGAPWRSFTWMTRDSPTTEIIGSGSPDKHSIIAWGPGHHYASTMKTVILWEIRPKSTVNWGCGRMLNFHATPALPGSWFWGGGPSPVALDYFNSSQTDDKDTSAHYEGLTFSAEPTGTTIEGFNNHRYHWTVMPLSQWTSLLNTWVSLTIIIGWGHIQIPGTDGSITVYVNGSNTPVIDVHGINTFFKNDYRDDGSGNVPPKPPYQEGVSMWTGGYVVPSNGFSTAEFGAYDYTMPRCGKDVAEALADGTQWPITEFTHTGQDSISTAGSTSSHTDVLASRNANQFLLPTVLGGGGGSPSTLPARVTPRFQSAATTVESDGERRAIVFGAGGRYAARTCWTLWSWHPQQGRVPGRVLSFDNQQTQGGLYNAPHRAGGLPAIELAWDGDLITAGQSGLVLKLNAVVSGQKVWAIMSVAEMDALLASGGFLDLAMELQIANDATGLVRIYAQGADTPRVNTGAKQTAWEAGGGYGAQTGYALHTGIYAATGVPSRQAIDATPPRVGPTLAEALFDGSTGQTIAEYAIDGTNLSGGGAQWAHAVLSSRDVSQFSLPVVLGGGGAPPPSGNALPYTGPGFGDRIPVGVPGSYGFNSKRASLYTSTRSGDVVSLWVYQRGYSDTGTLGSVTRRFFIYDTDGGNPASPTNLLVTCAPIILSTPSDWAWYEIPLPASFFWAETLKYFVGVQTSSQTGDGIVQGDHVIAGTERFVFAPDTYADGLSNPFGAVADAQTLRMTMFFAQAA